MSSFLTILLGIIKEFTPKLKCIRKKSERKKILDQLVDIYEPKAGLDKENGCSSEFHSNIKYWLDKEKLVIDLYNNIHRDDIKYYEYANEKQLALEDLINEIARLCKESLELKIRPRKPRSKITVFTF